MARAVMATASVLVALAVTPAAQTDRPSFYECVEGTEAEAPLVGVSLCDAAPTDALMARAETDNLQVRDGALAVAADPAGIAAAEGLQPGDVIYRVGGVDIAGAEAAAERLAGIVAERDTVVNFLRGGRPYRVKLRR